MSAAHYIEAAKDLQGNPEQWAAYESGGNCVILAGPGSGKTKTITIKIARLLAENIPPPQRIACITYSNACVGELRSRLNKLGIEDPSRLLVSTVHSFCLTELVIPYAQLAGLQVPAPLVVANPFFANELFSKAVHKVGGPGLKPYWVKTACEKLRRTIPDKNSREWQNWVNPRDTSIVETYEQELLKEGVIDFDGLVLAGLELVEQHEWVRKVIKAKYPIVVIDEYQDLGLPLHRIVLSLLNLSGARIIAVGDPDQSIYGFTGAQPRLLKALSSLPVVEAITLQLNYRCADKIIQASRTLLENPPEYRSHEAREGLITPHETRSTTNGQAEYALKEIVSSLLNANQEWSPGDIAFLYRSYNEGNAIAAEADSLGLQYFRNDRGSPIPRSRMSAWLQDMAKWCARGWKSGAITLSEILQSWRLLRRSFANEKDLLCSRKKIVHALFSNRDGDISLAEWLSVCREAFLDEMLEKEPALADEQDVLADLLKKCLEGGLLADYTVEIFGNQGKSPDQINLMTLHASKGLEFQAVIMIGLEEGVFPNNYDLKNEDSFREASRLFYVGITRAIDQVHLLYDRNESRFISGIKQAI